MCCWNPVSFASLWKDCSLAMCYDETVVQAATAAVDAHSNPITSHRRSDFFGRETTLLLGGNTTR